MKTIDEKERKMMEWTEGNGGERVKEERRCMAGECIVLVNEDLGHCVPANL